jgi:hypothetical protein
MRLKVILQLFNRNNDVDNLFMKIGIVLPVTGLQGTRENITQMAKDTEKDGFDSLWVLERLL